MQVSTFCYTLGVYSEQRVTIIGVLNYLNLNSLIYNCILYLYKKNDYGRKRSVKIISKFSIHQVYFMIQLVIKNHLFYFQYYIKLIFFFSKMLQLLCCQYFQTNILYVITYYIISTFKTQNLLTPYNKNCKTIKMGSYNKQIIA